MHNNQKQEPINNKNTILIFYIIECLIGTVIGYFVHQAYPIMGTWCFFSILLVLSPERKDVMKLAQNRIKANLIGAAIGLALLYMLPVTLFMLCVGITLAIIICEFLKLQEVMRSATIAVLITTLHEPGKYLWDVALERAGGVVIGCIIGILITYLFHVVILGSKRTLHKVKSIRDHPTIDS